MQTRCTQPPKSSTTKNKLSVGPKTRRKDTIVDTGHLLVRRLCAFPRRSDCHTYTTHPWARCMRLFDRATGAVPLLTPNSASAISSQSPHHNTTQLACTGHVRDCQRAQAWCSPLGVVLRDVTKYPVVRGMCFRVRDADQACVVGDPVRMKCGVRVRLQCTCVLIERIVRASQRRRMEVSVGSLGCSIQSMPSATPDWTSEHAVRIGDTCICENSVHGYDFMCVVLRGRQAC